jgi:hypothetical protein
MNLRFALSDVAKRFVDTIAKELQRPVAKGGDRGQGKHPRS